MHFPETNSRPVGIGKGPGCSLVLLARSSVAVFAQSNAAQASGPPPGSRLTNCRRATHRDRTQPALEGEPAGDRHPASQSPRFPVPVVGSRPRRRTRLPRTPRGRSSDNFPTIQSAAPPRPFSSSHRRPVPSPTQDPVTMSVLANHQLRPAASSRAPTRRRAPAPRVATVARAS